MSIATVKIWGEEVGVVAWNPKRRIAEFEYIDKFIRNGYQLAPIKMPLQKGVFRFVDHIDTKCFNGLPGLLADSLPERFGNHVLEAWLKKTNRSIDQLNPVERLCIVGNRGMGALTFEPTDHAHEAVIDEAIDLGELTTVAKAIETDRKSRTSQLSDNDHALEQLVQVGTSAGGAKAKALIAYNAETGEIRSGQIQAPENFKQLLLKFDDVESDEHAESQNLGRIEYAYYIMAQLCDIEMMHCKLIENGPLAHFATERFDRPGAGKLHVQTYSAMAHVDRDPPGTGHYENLLSTIQGLGLSKARVKQMYRRMVFNIVTRNQDDHPKNHAFIMGKNGEWDLSPAYDLCFSYKPSSLYIAQHQMCCNGKRDDFTKDDLSSVAKAFAIKDWNEIVDEVIQAAKAFMDVAAKIGVPSSQAEAIYRTFRFV